MVGIVGTRADELFDEELQIIELIGRQLLDGVAQFG